jgi:hypothetical protein
MRLPFTGHFLGLVIWDAREPDETESTRSPPASPGVVPLAMTLLKQNCSDGQRGRCSARSAPSRAWRSLPAR